MIIRFRVFDVGLRLPLMNSRPSHLVYFTIKEERTQFAMTGDHTASGPWRLRYQEYDYNTSKLSEIRGS